MLKETPKEMPKETLKTREVLKKEEKLLRHLPPFPVFGDLTTSVKAPEQAEASRGALLLGLGL